MTQKSQCYQTLKPKVIAAIPCYRTEHYVRDVVSRAKKYVDQVIVVDDGSDDGTGEMAREAGALVIRHEKNRGKGAAMKTAVQNSDADIVVFLDSDGQHNPDEIPELIEPIIQGRADLVIGSRHLPGSQIASPSFKRRLTNTLASIIISIVISVLLPLALWLNRLIKPSASSQVATNHQIRTKRWITDCTSGFRAITREAWQRLDLTADGFQIEAEMIYEAAKNKLLIAEVPISCNWKSGVSSLSIFRDGWKTVKLLAQKLICEVKGGQKVPRNQSL